MNLSPDPNPRNIWELDSADGSKRYEIVNVIMHPLFTIHFMDFDVALIQVLPKIELNVEDGPIPVCLPSATTWNSLMPSWEGTLMTVMGWGRDREDANSTLPVLKKLEDLPYVPFETCSKYLRYEKLYRWNRRILCAGYLKGGKDTCQGDSGGGLLVKQESNQYMQVGITSWGEGCARPNTTGIYTRVTEVMQWVYFHTGQQESKWCLEDTKSDTNKSQT